MKQEQVAELWHYAQPFMEKACEHAHGTESAQTIRARLDVDCGLLFMVHDDKTQKLLGSFAIEKSDDNIHVIALAGDKFADWINDAFRVLKDVAAFYDKHSITLKGRRGWTRRLAPLGFKPDGEYLRCEL